MLHILKELQQSKQFKFLVYLFKCIIVITAFILLYALLIAYAYSLIIKLPVLILIYGGVVALLYIYLGNNRKTTLLSIALSFIMSLIYLNFNMPLFVWCYFGFLTLVAIHVDLHTKNTFITMAIYIATLCLVLKLHAMR